MIVIQQVHLSQAKVAPKANYNKKGDGSDWGNTIMTLDSGTYNGKKVYKASFTDSL